MNCLCCGTEMETGTVEGRGEFFEGYEFTSKKEMQKKGIKGYFLRNTVSIPMYGGVFPAWHCPKCKKALLWLDSAE
ncbi:MAG: PF20097 family protein [Eubacteriales bacterium]|nr:PF20097 family protein [Eubacteriales bacterium]